jgi:hypothetical protein
MWWELVFVSYVFRCLRNKLTLISSRFTLGGMGKILIDSGMFNRGRQVLIEGLVSPPPHPTLSGVKMTNIQCRICITSYIHSSSLYVLPTKCQYDCELTRQTVGMHEL